MKRTKKNYYRIEIGLQQNASTIVLKFELWSQLNSMCLMTNTQFITGMLFACLASFPSLVRHSYFRNDDAILNKSFSLYSIWLQFDAVLAVGIFWWMCDLGLCVSFDWNANVFVAFLRKSVLFFFPLFLEEKNFVSRNNQSNFHFMSPSWYSYHLFIFPKFNSLTWEYVNCSWAIWLLCYWRFKLKFISFLMAEKNPPILVVRQFSSILWYPIARHRNQAIKRFSMHYIVS